MQIAILIVLSLIAVLLASLLWRTASPTQSSTPTPTSDDSAATLLASMMRETRALVLDLVQGRAQPPPTGPQETPLIESERQITYDYDSTPLPPGIVAVEEREQQEAQLEASLRERRAWQERIAEARRKETEAALMVADLEASSPGPWNGSGDLHDPT